MDRQSQWPMMPRSLNHRVERGDHTSRFSANFVERDFFCASTARRYVIAGSASDATGSFGNGLTGTEVEATLDEPVCRRSMTLAPASQHCQQGTR